MCAQRSGPDGAETPQECGPGGTVRPRAGRRTVDRSERIELRVDDNEAGVPPALTTEIFLPFFTTKANGTGVGLSLTRQVVQLHGGSIGLSPSPLGGAAFELIL